VDRPWRARTDAAICGIWSGLSDGILHRSPEYHADELGKENNGATRRVESSAQHYAAVRIDLRYAQRTTCTNPGTA